MTFQSRCDHGETAARSLLLIRLPADIPECRSTPSKLLQDLNTLPASSSIRLIAALLLTWAVFLFAACTDAPAPGRSDAALADSLVRPVSTQRQKAGIASTGDLSDTGGRADAQARMEQAIEQYKSYSDADWPEIPTGDAIEVGDSSSRVEPLRKRLAATGDLNEAEAATGLRTYDNRLAEAVKHFQRRHGLVDDGVLGPNTTKALNVRPSERVEQLQLNLKRLQDLPDTSGGRFLFVNIPEFTVRAYENGREVMQMGVIVGEEYDGKQTPVFDDKMEYVVFNPYWNVPDGIARDEIVPKAKQDRSYLQQNGYEITSNWGPNANVFDAQTTSLDRVASGELKIRQKPGPKNALGRVKFMFPNKYAIYLHGTPDDALFDNTTRAYSHGCIRVAKPAELAAYVLRNNPEWTRDRIDSALNGSEYQRVDLEEKIPVHILYLTAFVDQDGTVQFREDLYKLLPS